MANFSTSVHLKLKSDHVWLPQPTLTTSTSLKKWNSFRLSSTVFHTITFRPSDSKESVTIVPQTSSRIADLAFILLLLPLPAAVVHPHTALADSRPCPAALASSPGPQTVTTPFLSCCWPSLLSIASYLSPIPRDRKSPSYTALSHWPSSPSPIHPVRQSPICYSGSQHSRQNFLKSIFPLVKVSFYIANN